MNLGTSLLGKKVKYESKYNPKLLFFIPRQDKRKEIGICDTLPFLGMDIWNAYELSWLDNFGKPHVAIGTFIIPANSKYLIESKSLKLYLNSFNNTKFKSMEEVVSTIKRDISRGLESNLDIIIEELEHAKADIVKPQGICIDNIDINILIDDLNPSANLLEIEGQNTHEKLYSNLLKSNCLITGQPDWATLLIEYKGKKLKHQSLLKYIISFRNHNEFHEQCVERIFVDLYKICAPQYLSVYARYTRRGGLDISPYRSTGTEIPSNTRLIRQ